MRFTLPDMSCGHCRGAVETAIAGADPAAKSQIDTATKTVEIHSTRSADEIADVLRDAGYPPAPN